MELVKVRNGHSGAADEGPRVKVGFPGGRKVSVEIGGHTILTDQPREVGGDDEAPSPYSLFLASIGACAGFYALTFCQRRDLPTEGLEVTAHPRAEDGTLAEVELRIALPAGFPEKYRGALIRSVDQCSVKRAILAQPAFRIEVTASNA
ncbi:MAG TPA: OsmC family protein [Vulgatibacter sp.]|nr:OsmC family protein [Vulgatibacter sp.]